MAQDDFQAHVHAFVNDIGNTVRPTASQEEDDTNPVDPPLDNSGHPIQATSDRMESHTDGPTTSTHDHPPTIHFEPVSGPDRPCASTLDTHTEPPSESATDPGVGQEEPPRSPATGRDPTEARDLPQPRPTSRPGPLREIFNVNQEVTTTAIRQAHMLQCGLTKRTPTHLPRSRPKAKCGFGPRKPRTAALTSTHRSLSPSRTANPPSTHDDAITRPAGGNSDLDEMLRAIDITRHYDLALDTEERLTSDRMVVPVKSRPKKRCKFGPLSRGSHTRPHSDQHAPPPSADPEGESDPCS